MIIGTKRTSEARVHDSEAGYHRFHDEDGNEYGSFEVFWHDGGALFPPEDPNEDYDEGYEPEPGWYWQPCFPGCLPDGDASGPFGHSVDARRDADEYLTPPYETTHSRREKMAHNGWTNYETWNVNLWIDNEEPLYRTKMRELRTLTDPITGEDVREFFYTYMNGTTPDLDNLKADGETIDPINWNEIAEKWEAERQELLRDA